MSNQGLNIKELADLERSLGLDDLLIKGIPIWRIIRFRIRSKFARKIGRPSKTKKTKLALSTILQNFVDSYRQFKRLKHQQTEIENIVFAFPRLYKIRDSYVDKFTDPLIELSDLKRSYIIFQRYHSGQHHEPRIHQDKTIKMDYIELSSLLCAIITLPLFALKHWSTLRKLFHALSCIDPIGIKEHIIHTLQISSFFIQVKQYRKIFSLHETKRIFIVDRAIFFAPSVAIKSLDGEVFELQHGITMGDTILYTGDYRKEIDPDYFLTFGSIWTGPQFGIPEKRIKCIGWGYREMLQINQSTSVLDKTILVISTPQITKEIVELTAQWARWWDHLQFHIRLHPQEELSSQQEELLGQYQNIQISDTKIDSFIALQSYSHVVGDISSVLFEALSMGKLVGKLNFGIFASRSTPSQYYEDFSIINTPKDLLSFAEQKNLNHHSDKFYTDFDAAYFNHQILDK